MTEKRFESYSAVTVKQVVFFVVLMMTLIFSSFALIYSIHLSRKLFNELQELQKHRDQLQIDWGRLLLEQSTWGAYSRIEQIARSQLGMKAPDTKDIVLIERVMDHD